MCFREPRPTCAQLPRVKTNPIILDLQGQSILLTFKRDVHFSRLSMLQGVIQRFNGQPIQIFIPRSRAMQISLSKNNDLGLDPNPFFHHLEAFFQ